MECSCQVEGFLDPRCFGVGMCGLPNNMKVGLPVPAMPIPEQAVEAALWEYRRVITKAADDTRQVTSDDQVAAMRAAITAAQPLMGVQRPKDVARAIKEILRRGCNEDVVVLWTKDILAVLALPHTGQPQRVTDSAVRAGARVLADAPTIDAPKLPAECWEGTVRAILEAALPYLSPVPQAGCAKEGLERLETLYVKNVAALEEMKARGDLTKDYGEFSLSIARLTLEDIRREKACALSASPPPPVGDTLCGDCPPADYPTDKTRCLPCPRRPIVAEQETK